MTPANTPLWQLADRGPDQVALRDATTEMTWRELDHATHRIGRGLEALGLGPGDHVAQAVTNRVEFIACMLGTLRAGCTMTPVKTNWTADEIAYLVADAGSRAVIADVAAAKEVAATADLPLIDLDADFGGWLDAQADSPLPPGRVGYRIAYTSGTTGRPKGVRRQQEAALGFEDWVRASAYGSQAVGLPRDGQHLMVSQLFHGAPLAFGLGALLAGAPMRIMGRWDPATTLEALAEGCTASIMVPTMFRQLLALPHAARAAFDPGNLVTVLHGGEACPVELKRRMIDWWGPILVEYYGFTEGGMTTVDVRTWLERPGTVGRAFANQEILVLSDAGERLPPGQVGTVYFVRPEGHDTFVYLNEAIKTDAAYTAEGAFTVGDLGYLDDDGYLYLTGRSADLIVSSGVNVYPAEIEAVIFEVAGVADACVAGAPDEQRGEQAVAVIVVAPGHADEQVCDAVAAACEARLAGYKRPRRIEVRDQVPRDPTGKTLRTTLRDELWADQTESPRNGES